MASLRKHFSVLLILILTVAMGCCFTGCSGESSGEPEYAEDAAYLDLPVMEDLVTTVSTSSSGNEFGKIKITFKWKPDMEESATATDAFYLEYTYFDDNNYQPIVIQNDSDKLANETITLKPNEKQTITVDVDAYYDHCNEGFYRLVKVFDVKSLNGKTKQYAAYIEIGGNNPASVDD